MMESLFRLTELEARIPLNMNVLVDGVVPRVVGLAEALRQWLDHRRTVLQRRSLHRRAEIDHRLEVLGGMLIAFLNLDEVIRIIREEDEPKEVLKSTFTLTDVQANYILDTRLRALRRLEEMQIKTEYDALTKEREQLSTLLDQESQQWKAITAQIRDVKRKYGPDTTIGRRRTSFESMPDIQEAAINEAMVEREPITVVVSEKGWIRALKGHITSFETLTFKGDDRFRLSFLSESNAKLLVVATDGQVFTLEASRLPGGRSVGEPIRIMADIAEGADVAAVLPYRVGTRLLMAASDGRGFSASQDDMVGGTRKGKSLMSVDGDAKVVIAVPAEGDHVAVIGENRKLLVFPTAQLPHLARGKGMRLQRYKDGGLSDAKLFTLAQGLTWRDTSGRTWTVSAADLRDWIGNRAEAGRLPPKGFPKNNKFEG
jgi:topoisomerase-4 subunit A